MKPKFKKGDFISRIDAYLPDMRRIRKVTKTHYIISEYYSIPISEQDGWVLL
jgi:hypothetical protein